MVKISITIFSLLSILILSPVAEARTFKIATIAPDGTTWMKKIREGANLIQEKTQGRVKFKFYTGGVMGSDKSMLKKMRIGQLHGGAFTGGGLAEIYPDIQIYSLPFIFQTIDEVDYVRNKMDEMISAGLHNKGIKVLGISEGGFAYFMSRTPVRRVEELSTLKNWLPEGDTISQTIYETVGISPIQLPLSDVYTGLQTGLIDTIGSNTTGAIAFQWHTKVKYVTDIPLIFLVGAFVLDEKAFSKINAKDKKIVTDTMAQVFKELDAINRKDNENAREALKQQGIEFLSLTKQEEIRWGKLADTTIQSMKQKGLYTEKMYNVLTSMLQEYRQKNKLKNAK